MEVLTSHILATFKYFKDMFAIRKQEDAVISIIVTAGKTSLQSSAQNLN